MLKKNSNVLTYMDNAEVCWVSTIKSYNKYNSDIMYVEQINKRPYFKTVSQYIYQNVKKINQTDKIDKLVKNIVTIMDMKYLLDKKLRTLTPSQFRWVELAAKIASFLRRLIALDHCNYSSSVSNFKTIRIIPILKYK